MFLLVMVSIHFALYPVMNLMQPAVICITCDQAASVTRSNLNVVTLRSLQRCNHCLIPLLLITVQNPFVEFPKQNMLYHYESFLCSLTFV